MLKLISVLAVIVHLICTDFLCIVCLWRIFVTQIMARSFERFGNRLQTI